MQEVNTILESETDGYASIPPTLTNDPRTVAAIEAFGAYVNQDILVTPPLQMFAQI